MYGSKYSDILYIFSYYTLTMSEIYFILSILTLQLRSKDTVMPDGDRIHPRLARPYQKVYQQLCEGHFNGESLATEAVETVRHQLQQGGDAPAQLVVDIASHLEEIPKEALFRQLVDWPAKSRDIEQLVAQAELPKRIGDHITEASKELLYDLRTGEPIANQRIELMERAMNRLYSAEFEERVPMNRHYNGVSQLLVAERLAEMRPYVEQKLTHLARQAAKRVTFQRLRRPPSVKPSIRLHETDIFSLD
jgi:hypothetical protein